MAATGLTAEGFTPKTLTEIQDSIKSKLEVLSPGFDFSTEAPDGQLIEIMAFELSQVWNELNFVYRSYDPQQAVGAGLRNIGLITGIIVGAATRSQATVDLTGTAGVLIPTGSLVSDADGNDYVTQFDVELPGSVQVVAVLSGEIPVPISTIIVVKTVIAGWVGCAQPIAGSTGGVAQTEQAFRNIRNRTVLRNYTGAIDTIQGRLFELGLEQVSILHNNTAIATTIPANTIAISVSPLAAISDDAIARVILDTKPAGIATDGTTAVVLDDLQGNTQTINFTKATAVNIYMNITVTYLDEDYAGAEESILGDVISLVNDLQVGEDVIQSRLYGVITPYGKAQVDLLELGTAESITGSVDPTASINVVGVSTLFNSEISVGDKLIINGEIRNVATITDDLNLTVDLAYTDTANDTTLLKVVMAAANVAIADGEYAFCATGNIDYVGGP